MQVGAVFGLLPLVKAPVTSKAAGVLDLLSRENVSNAPVVSMEGLCLRMVIKLLCLLCCGWVLVGSMAQRFCLGNVLLRVGLSPRRKVLLLFCLTC